MRDHVGVAGGVHDGEGVGGVDGRVTPTPGQVDVLLVADGGRVMIASRVSCRGRGDVDRGPDRSMVDRPVQGPATPSTTGRGWMLLLLGLLNKMRLATTNLYSVHIGIKRHQ